MIQPADMRTCARCERRVAAVRRSQRAPAGAKTAEPHETWLCMACLRAELRAMPQAPRLDLARFFGQLTHLRPPRTAAALPRIPADARCARCGLTYAEFAEVGLLGCPACYEAFASVLEVALEILHGAG